MAGEFSIITVITGLVSGYIGSVLTQNRLRWYEKKSIANAFSSEVSIITSKMVSLTKEIENISNMKDSELFNKSLNLTIEGHALGISNINNIDKDDISIYNGNTSKIGIFSSDEVQEIIQFYHLAKLVIKCCSNINILIGMGLKIEEIPEEKYYNIIVSCHLASNMCELLSEEGEKILEMLVVYEHNWLQYLVSRISMAVKSFKLPYRKFRT
jgi:hypothetical protein